MKKVISLVLTAALLVLTVSGCAGTGDVYRVGICQFVEHDALDAATKGFKDALTEKLGNKVVFDEKNASNEPANCTTIANQFVSDDVDLIMANATPALQAAAAATATIPILGTSVTDYATALNIDNWTGTTGKNISGTSDLAPLDKQADMILELYPNTKKVAVLFCSGEPNSDFQFKEITKLLNAKNVETKAFKFTDSNDLANVTNSAIEYGDVIYVPTDNTAAANANSIGNIVSTAKEPLIAGEKGICTGCGVATLAIDYYDLGYQTGLMAAKILTEDADVATMPVEFAQETQKFYNQAMCNVVGLDTSALTDYTVIAD